MALIAKKLTRSASNDDEAQGYRQPPHSIEAEQALLGAVLVNNQAFDRVAGFLEPAHFFDPVHQRIFETAGKLIRAGKQATPITLKTFFENAEPISPDLTVPQYLGTLAGNATTIINAKDYGSTIADLATRRALIVIGEDMVNEAFDSSVDNPPADQIDRVQSRLDEASEGKASRQSVSISEAAQQSIDRANEAYASGGKSAGLSTGFLTLDRKLGGLSPGHLYVVAGRPGMGKSAIAANIAQNVAAGGKPAAFVSLEMEAVDLADRILARMTGIPACKMKDGEATEAEIRTWMDASRRLEGWPLRIEEAGAMSIAHLASRARQIRRRHGLELLVVDYLQLLQGSAYRGGKGDGNRQNEITEISGGLKAIAKDLRIPVIALSQLSRNVEHREDKRPRLSDLRESGSIEQDADVVIFPFREAYYLENAPPPLNDPGRQDWEDAIARLGGVAEIIIAKHRHRAVGTITMGFTSNLTSFHELDEVR